MYEFRQKSGHGGRHALPNCCVHFVSLSREDETVQGVSWTETSIGRLTDVWTSAAVCVKTSHRTDVSLIWDIDSYHSCFKVVMCVDIKIILFPVERQCL